MSSISDSFALWMPETRYPLPILGKAAITIARHVRYQINYWHCRAAMIDTVFGLSDLGHRVEIKPTKIEVFH